MDKNRKPLSSKNNKTKTEEFIKKAKQKHGNKYDYSKTEYVAVRVKVTITCQIHGDFQQTPESHLKPMGCFKCGYLDYNRAKTHNRESFIDKSNDIYNNFYNYSKSSFVDLNTDIVITCPVHGDFEQSPKNHFMRGCRKCTLEKTSGVKNEQIEELINNCVKSYNKEISKSFRNSIFVDLVCQKHGLVKGYIRQDLNNINCPICNKKEIKKRNFTVESFRNILSKIHDSNLDFTKTEYVKSDNKVKYICKKHGEKEALPANLLKGHGCKECSLNKPRYDRSKWIDKLNEKHDFMYDYTKLSNHPTYDNTEIIICKTHGDFLQSLGSHAMGSGCTKCANERCSRINSENPLGWSYSVWEDYGSKSKKFDSFKVYIIRCWNEYEEFYKIGKTFSTVKMRFQSKCEMPYNWELINTIESISGRKICEMEYNLKTINKNNVYVPKIKFGGMYECFSKVIYE